MVASERGRESAGVCWLAGWLTAARPRSSGEQATDDLGSKASRQMKERAREGEES